ncbi:MAG: hypothetical protein HOV80_14265 [Polyangiaceae bacterium]|nr:hypothetical protein [Polyangiaceae bacterium]
MSSRTVLPACLSAALVWGTLLSSGDARADEPAAAAPATPAAPSQPVVQRRGVAVVLVGPWEDTQAKHARDLARGVYRTPKLRPDLDEGTVRILTGGEPSGDDAAAKRLSELRSALTPDLTTEASKNALAGLAAELPVGSIVLFIPGSAGPVVRLAHVDGSASPPVTKLDPASIAPSPKEGEPGALDLDPVLASLERLIAPKAEAKLPPSPQPAAKPKPKPGPRKDNLKKTSGTEAPDKPKEDSSFYESPWFWVAVGGVAATGLTILIVSQTTDVGEGSVALKGKVVSQSIFTRGFVW